MAKRTLQARQSSEPAAPGEPETVSTAPAEGEAVDTEWPLIVERQKSGTQRGHLITVVRAYAKRKVEDEDDDDGRWAKVKTLSDEAIWGVIQWCDYERGAINQMSRAARMLGIVDGSVQ